MTFSMITLYLEISLGWIMFVNDSPMLLMVIKYWAAMVLAVKVLTIYNSRAIMSGLLDIAITLEVVCFNT